MSTPRVPLSVVLQDPDFLAASPEERAQFLKEYETAAPPQAPNPRGFLDKFDRQLQGAPMGISNSAARTTAGTAKLLGADISPEFMSALQPRPGEELGNVMGDVGQLAAGGAALKVPAFAATKGTTLGPAILRMLEQSGKSALSSGALTGLQTGGDVAAMKRDAGVAGGVAGVASAGSSLLKGTGKWLASAPFSGSTPEKKEILEQVLLPKALGGFLPRGIDNMKASSAVESEAAGEGLKAGISTSPRSSMTPFLNAMEAPRSRFTFPESRVKPLSPTNPNFFRFPTKEDAAIRPEYQAPVAHVDDILRKYKGGKGSQPGISMVDINNLKRELDRGVTDATRANVSNATPQKEVLKVYADSLRDLMHKQDGGKLSPLLTRSHRAQLAEGMVDDALKGDITVGGTTLKGAKFRKGMGLAAVAMAPFSPAAAATTATLAYPMQTGWGLNRAGQLANLASTAPAVRGAQTAIKPKDKNKNKK